MSDVLARICADKREIVARRKAARPLAVLEDAARICSPVRGFADRLRAQVAAGRYALIAEIKKASPSRGLIRADFDPPALARAYRDGGAQCLSVLTDEQHFQGRDDFVEAVRAVVDLPVLRKDFMLEPYQIIESRAIGADCVLLILAALDDVAAQELMAVASAWGMDVLVEVHDEAELDRALALDAMLIGINNRNLKTMTTDLATTERLSPRVPPHRLLICESGLEQASDLARMSAAGAHCFLVGSSLMAQTDVAAATRALLARDDRTRATA